jgi:hypothetical protein
MENESYINSKRKIFSFSIALLMIVLSFTVTPLLILMPDYSMVKDFAIFIWFLGGNTTIATLGLLFISFSIIKQWRIDKDFINKIIEKKIDNDNKSKMQGCLNNEALLRSNFDKERLHVNDLFRLIETAKDKTEEIPEKTTASESKGAEKMTITEKTFKKNEEVNVVKLEEIVKLYLSLIQNKNLKVFSYV